MRGETSEFKYHFIASNRRQTFACVHEGRSVACRRRCSSWHVWTGDGKCPRWSNQNQKVLGSRSFYSRPSRSRGTAGTCPVPFTPKRVSAQAVVSVLVSFADGRQRSRSAADGCRPVATACVDPAVLPCVELESGRRATVRRFKSLRFRQTCQIQTPGHDRLTRGSAVLDRGENRPGFGPSGGVALASAGGACAPA